MKLCFSEFVSRLIVLLFCAIVTQSCGEAVEGCMVPQASNFDPEADADCCCTYFQLVPQIILKDDRGNTFVLDSMYTDASNDSFKLLNIKVQGSGIRLRSASTNTWSNTGLTVSVKPENGSRESVADNFSWQDIAVNNSEGLGWIQADRYDSIRFNIGLPANLRFAGSGGFGG